METLVEESMDIFERILSGKSGGVKKEKIEKIQKEEKITHLMIRFNDHLGKDTIKEHTRVSKRNGYVWFGKIGRPIKKAFIDSFNKVKGPVYAFFLKKSMHNVTVYKAEILSITKDDLRKTSEIKNIPEYVAILPVEFGFWVKVASFEKIPNSILTELIVCSSRAALIESLSSTVGIMFVEYDSQ